MAEININSERRDLILAEEKLAKKIENIALFVINDFEKYRSKLDRKLNMPLHISGGEVKEARYDSRDSRYSLRLKPFRLPDEEKLMDHNRDIDELKLNIEDFIKAYTKRTNWVDEISFDME